MNIDLIVNGKIVGTYGSVLHALKAYREMVASGARILSARVNAMGRLVQVII